MRRKVFNHRNKNLQLIALPVLLLVLYLFYLPRPLFNNPTSTVIYDTKGDLLGARIADDGQCRFPENMQVSEKFSEAIVAFEDKQFYNHLGVDVIVIGRAILRNIQSGKIEEGGSTLSMQVIRLARKNKSRTLLEKFIEAVLATQLELRYSKG
jgi:penicillin-binding protein 1C